jgi:hypothetical protein
MAYYKHVQDLLAERSGDPTLVLPEQDEWIEEHRREEVAANPPRGTLSERAAWVGAEHRRIAAALMAETLREMRENEEDGGEAEAARRIQERVGAAQAGEDYTGLAERIEELSPHYSATVAGIQAEGHPLLGDAQAHAQTSLGNLLARMPGTRELGHAATLGLVEAVGAGDPRSAPERVVGRVALADPESFAAVAGDAEWETALKAAAESDKTRAQAERQRNESMTDAELETALHEASAGVWGKAATAEKEETERFRREVEGDKGEGESEPLRPSTVQRPPLVAGPSGEVWLD